MSFEDVIRVAQLKFRKDALTGLDEPMLMKIILIKLTDCSFKPGREELSPLPKSLSWLVPKLKILSRGKGLAQQHDRLIFRIWFVKNTFIP